MRKICFLFQIFNKLIIRIEHVYNILCGRWNLWIIGIVWFLGYTQNEIKLDKIFINSIFKLSNKLKNRVIIIKTTNIIISNEFDPRHLNDFYL